MATWAQRVGAAGTSGESDAQAAAAMREEWRAQQESETADAVEEFRHRRTLKDVAIETLHRGDPIVVIMPNVRFHGNVECIGPDLISLRTVGGRVDVHLHDGVPMMIQIGERVRDGGGRESVGDGDFRSALIAREAFGEVTMGCTLLDEPVEGKLVVGLDHACIVGRGGGETFFPLHTVTYVMARRD